MPKIKDLGINVIPETMRPPEIGAGGGCVPCTLTVGPVCVPGGFTRGCDCSVSPVQDCGCTNITNPCLGCTVGGFATVCHGPTNCGFVSPVTCHGCTIGITPTYCPPATYAPCPPTSFTGCPHLSCWASNCGFVSPIVNTPTALTVHQFGGLTRDSIAQLKKQLQDQIAQLDEHAKSIGPQTAEEIDAREKELKSELEELAGRRSDLKKK